MKAKVSLVQKEKTKYNVFFIYGYFNTIPLTVTKKNKKKKNERKKERKKNEEI